MDKNATLSYPEVLLSSIQVQQMLGLSRTSVWRPTRRGLLLFMHIGAALRFRHSDMRALIQVGTSQHPTQKARLRGLRERKGRAQKVCEERPWGFMRSLRAGARARRCAGRRPWRRAPSCARRRENARRWPSMMAIAGMPHAIVARVARKSATEAS